MASTPEEEEEDKVKELDPIGTHDLDGGTGTNPGKKCMCLPIWWCCGDRFCSIRTAVQLVGAFNTISNLLGWIFTTFIIMVWKFGGRATAGVPNSTKTPNLDWWKHVVLYKNGIIMLDISYLMMVVVGVVLFVGSETKRRCVPVVWLLGAVYSTATQLFVLFNFKFYINYVNIPFLVVRVYEIWTVLCFDLFLKRVKKEAAALKKRQKVKGHGGRGA